jgi:hypothetical protein
MSKRFMLNSCAFLFLFLFYSVILCYADENSTATVTSLSLAPETEDFFSGIVSVFAGTVCGFVAVMTWGSWR